MSGETFNPEASQEQITTATADNPNSADIVQQELIAARENMKDPGQYDAWLTQMQYGADGKEGGEDDLDSQTWGMVEFYDSVLDKQEQCTPDEGAPLPGGTAENPGRILHTEKGPDGQEERPTLIVAEDGTSTGLHYGDDGQIDAYNQTLPDGSHRQYRQGEDGQWGVFDGEGKPVEGEQANVSQAFVDKEGNFVTVHNGADNQPSSISVGQQRYERGEDGKWNVPGATGTVTEVSLDDNHQVAYKTDDGRTVTNAADGSEITDKDGLTTYREKPGGDVTKYEKDGYSFRRDDDGEWWYHNDKDGGKQVSIGTPRVDEETGEVKADETGWSLGKDVVLG